MGNSGPRSLKMLIGGSGSGAFNPLETRRVFGLSKELDTGRLTAELKQGVLTLRIPKAEHARPKRIKVDVG